MWEAWVWGHSQPGEISQLSQDRKMFRPAGNKAHWRGVGCTSPGNKAERAKGAQVGAELEHQALQYRIINNFFFWSSHVKKKISILLHFKHTEESCKSREWSCSSKMWLSNGSLGYLHNHDQVLEKRQCALVFVDLCAHVQKRHFEYGPLNCDLFVAWAKKRI